MKLIADSGSTKTIWYLVSSEAKPKVYHTQGYNPFLVTTAEIQSSLKTDLLSQLNVAPSKVESIYFYGAGCTDTPQKASVRSALAQHFKTAHILVENDLLAVARACCGQEPGICGILGTGSNACVFDGNKITWQHPSLGYILGDEGSGNYIGKALLRSYFYGQMPADLHAQFAEAYQLKRHDFLKNLFNSDMPNRYLATFCYFCTQYRSHEFIKTLIKQAFDDFINSHLVPLLSQNTSAPIVYFSGSVAHGFQSLLERALKNHNIQLGSVIKHPFPQLLDYHKKN